MQKIQSCKHSFMWLSRKMNVSPTHIHPHLHITHINVFRTEQCTYLHTLLPAHRDIYLHGNIDRYFTDLYIQHNTQGQQHTFITHTNTYSNRAGLSMHSFSFRIIMLCVCSYTRLLIKSEQRLRNEEIFSPKCYIFSNRSIHEDIK